MSDDTKKIFYFTGPCAYAKVFEDNRNLTGFEGAYEAFGGMYEILVGLGEKDAKQMFKFNRNYKPRTAEELKLEEPDDYKGYLFFPFRRKHKTFNREGEVIKAWSGPPTILDKNNDPWPEGTLIGNGSVVTVKVNVSKRGSRNFLRLESVRVEDLVPYEGPEDVEKINEPDIPF